MSDYKTYEYIWLDGYQPERFYSLLFKVVSGSGTNQEMIQIFDEGHTFKVGI